MQSNSRKGIDISEKPANRNNFQFYYCECSQYTVTTIPVILPRNVFQFGSN